MLINHIKQQVQKLKEDIKNEDKVCVDFGMEFTFLFGILFLVVIVYADEENNKLRRENQISLNVSAGVLAHIPIV